MGSINNTHKSYKISFNIVIVWSQLLFDEGGQSCGCLQYSPAFWIFLCSSINSVPRHLKGDEESKLFKNFVSFTKQRNHWLRITNKGVLLHHLKNTLSKNRKRGNCTFCDKKQQQRNKTPENVFRVEYLSADNIFPKCCIFVGTASNDLIFLSFLNGFSFVFVIGMPTCLQNEAFSSLVCRMIRRSYIFVSYLLSL